MANWFDNGIKRISGLSVYFTVLGGDLLGRHIISSLGTVFDIKFTVDTGNIGNPPPVTLEEQDLFIAGSQTKISLKRNTITFTHNGVYYTYEPPLCTLDNNTISTSAVSDTAVRDLPKSNSPVYSGYLTPFDKIHGRYDDKVATPYTGSYGQLAICTSMMGKGAHWMFQHSTAVRANADEGWYDCTDTSIKCTFINDVENERIILCPIANGFREEISASSVDIYNIDHVVTDIVLLSIPYTMLNNTDYFDPEEDAAPPRPEPGAPGFEGDPAEPGGGGGNYINYPTDDIPFPELPVVSAIDTGFLTMYNPSSAQLQSLVDYLWTSDWVDTIKKMISNPMDAIIGLNLVPYDPGTIAVSTCKIGAISTGISMNKITEQYKILDCGTVQVPEHWGNALDYNNVNISIALPFVGIRSLDTNLVMNSTVSLKYYVDLLTGSAIAMLEISKSNTSKSVYYNFECNLNYQIPVTGANYAETIKALMSTVSSGIGLVSNAATSNAAGALSSATSMVASAFMAGSGAHHYESSGNLSANIGMLGQFQPYIIVELPKQSLPANFKKNKGYTSNITATLGSLTGYTEASYYHLDGIPATDQEKNLIDSALRSGVIL